MLGRRSLYPELEPVDPEIDQTYRQHLRNQLENQNQILEMTEEGEKRPLRDYLAPFQFNSPSCIVLPQTTASHFELKPGVIQLLPTFYGLEKEDPYHHVKEFLDICATFRFQNFSEESIKLRRFPFSLKDKAKAWQNFLEVGNMLSHP